MRHRKSGRQLNRNSSHRKAMFRNMACSLIEHQVIKTTLPKAKELRKVIEPIITHAKNNDSVSGRRQAFDRLRSDEAVATLFNDIAPRFLSRNGGYVRILKFGFRTGDKSPMAFVELLDREGYTATNSEVNVKPNESSKTKKTVVNKVEDKKSKDKSSFDADLAKSAFGKKIKQDDLTIIEGIGPKISELFVAAGISTWDALGKAEVEHCKEVLSKAGDRYKMHDPDTWPRQAAMAAEGKWEELADWQDKLDGGREA